MRTMVVVTIIMFKAGYFLEISKYCLIPEQFMTYIGFDCDAKYSRFLVPREGVKKYIPILENFTSSFADMEKVVGKASRECALPAGMWFRREQYSAMRLSGTTSLDF